MFTTLVSKLTSAPILAFSDYNVPFTVQTDASLDGLGAVLTQKQDGKERVLTEAEAKYPTHKLEFKALHWAVTTKFREYLYGN